MAKEQVDKEVVELAKWAEKLAIKIKGDIYYSTIILEMVFRGVKDGYKVSEMQQEIESAYGVMV